MVATASSNMLFIDTGFGLEPSTGHCKDALVLILSSDELFTFSFCNA